MERVSKATFVAMSNRRIEMYEEFTNALNNIQPLVTKYDGKKINKRFIDAVNDAIKDVAPNTKFAFATNYKGERENRFRLWYGNRWVESVNGYISDYENILYPCDSIQPYLDEEFRLNADSFLKAIDRELNRLINYIKSYTEAIQKVDEVIETYNSLKEYAYKTLDTIPSPLRSRIIIDSPIY